jgi:hypothetical protein
MIKSSLQNFVETVLERRRITAEDVAALQRSVLPDGLFSREEADVLIALDRAVPVADPAWPALLTDLVVGFAVWTCRPTGVVEAEAARWLVASLQGAGEPTETALRIAFEVVRDAERADEALVRFAMTARRPAPDLAAAPFLELAA